MDIQIPFIFVSLFSLASVVLIFIYKFGIKEKSYEEALAEQRQQTHILLGVKPKLKEKKSKKPSKKVQVKEKVTESEVVNEPEQAETNEKKPHVDFKEEAEPVPTVPIKINKKQAKKEKIRPILVNKETPENEKPNNNGLSYPSNHFEELHPKDDFELFRKVTEEATKEEIPAETDQKPTKKHESEPVVVQKETAPVLQAPPINGIIGNTGKEKKKKKSEFNLQQQFGDNNGPNMSVLVNLVRKAELSRSEVQILIDLLLNKQHEAPAIIDEWSEGKSDPVQKLKKQLAEKEKLLSEEQQVVASAQTKLREIRSEYQNEKSGLLQKIRNLEEMVHGKQMEANRNLQQVQQLQNQIKEEVVKNHKLREEQTALQMQRQQFEMRLGQAQESEAIITQLQTEIQELSSINNQMRMDLNHFSEEKERNQTLIFNFQKELEQKTERNRQLEETRLQLQDKLDAILNQENDIKVEVSRLNSVIQQQDEEIKRLEHGAKQELQKHKDESCKIINQLTIDLRQAREENVQIKMTQMNGSLQETKQHEVEMLNLHNELSSVKTQLHQVETQSTKEVIAANAIVEKLQKQVEELKLQVDEERTKLQEQKTKNNALRERNWKVMEALNAAESKIKVSRTKSDEDIQKEFIQRLFPEIDAKLYKSNGEKFIKEYIEDLKRGPESSDSDEQLKLQLQHYKNVIDNTEKMLNKLQKHIEQEEIKWRVQLAAKTDELEQVKENHRQELLRVTARLEQNDAQTSPSSH